MLGLRGVLSERTFTPTSMIKRLGQCLILFVPLAIILVVSHILFLISAVLLFLAENIADFGGMFLELVTGYPSIRLWRAFEWNKK